MRFIALCFQRVTLPERHLVFNLPSGEGKADLQVSCDKEMCMVATTLRQTQEQRGWIKKLDEIYKDRKTDSQIYGMQLKATKAKISSDNEFGEKTPINA